MSFLKKLFRLGGCSRLYSPDSVEAGIVMMEEEECLECGLENRDNGLADLQYIPWTSPGQLQCSWLPEVSFPFAFKLLGNGCIDTDSSFQSWNILFLYKTLSSIKRLTSLTLEHFKMASSRLKKLHMYIDEIRSSSNWSPHLWHRH